MLGRRHVTLRIRVGRDDANVRREGVARCLAAMMVCIGNYAERRKSVTRCLVALGVDVGDLVDWGDWCCSREGCEECDEEA